MAWDGEKFGQAIVEQVNASIDRVVAPLIKRLDELEQRQSADMEALKRKLDDDLVRFDASLKHAVTAEQIKDLRGELEQTIGPELQIALAKMVEELPPAPAGKDAEPIDMSVVKQMIADEVASLPPAPAGKDAELPDIAGMIAGMIADMIPAPVAPELPDIAGMIDEAVKALPPAPAGKDAEPIDMDVVKSMITEMIPAPVAGKDAEPIDMSVVKSMIYEAVAALPPAAPGKDADPIDMTAVKSMIDEAVANRPVVKDGMINRDGELLFTFSDGEIKNFGRVVGKDGDDGVDCDIDGVWKILNEKLAALPPPTDGKDGMGFDDLSVEYDGERTFKFVLARGDERKSYEFAVPVLLYQGLFTDGKSYTKGDSVTWGGSVWIAQTPEATEKPGTGKEWRLAVKQGKPGKDGVTITPRPNEPVKLGGR